MQKQQLEQLLSKGSVVLNYVKKDGTPTVRRVTLDPTLIPTFEPKTGRVTKQSLDTVRCWDLQKLGWISLIPANVSQ